MLKIYTSTIYWYKEKSNGLDVTVKSATKGVAFSPTWKMVNRWLESEKRLADMQQYALDYRDLMRKSFRNNYADWQWLLQQEEIVLLCYCKADEFCHRFLLSALLVIQGAQYVGEIQKDGTIRHAPADEVQRWIEWYKQAT